MYLYRRGYTTTTTRPKPPSLDIVQVNHMSLETMNVDRLVIFYQTVLGLPALQRPNFGFGGAWLQLPSGMALHIIERDPEKPWSTADGVTTERITTSSSSTTTTASSAVPERFIRRSHHVALTVLNIDHAKTTLRAHKVSFAINKVPDTSIVVSP